MKYHVHMLSFENTREGGYSVAFGNGANLQPWHLDLLEQWIKEQRAIKHVDSGEDLV